MPTGNSSRVRFDFEGSLVLARKLWALGDHLNRVRASRCAEADLAGNLWRGRYADEFRSRMGDEAISSENLAGALHDEAKGWATCWKRAMDEQNRRNRAKKVDAVRASRPWAERYILDAIVGDDSDRQVRAAPLAAVPQPPSFQATCTEKRY